MRTTSAPSYLRDHGSTRTSSPPAPATRRCRCDRGPGADRPRWMIADGCPPPGDRSLPSNHATLAFGAVVVIAIAAGRTWIAWTTAALAALVAVGRVLQGVQYLHDVALRAVFGLVIPTALVVLALTVVRLARRRTTSRRSGSRISSRRRTRRSTAADGRGSPSWTARCRRCGRSITACDSSSETAGCERTRCSGEAALIRQRRGSRATRCVDRPAFRHPVASSPGTSSGSSPARTR